MPIGGSIPSPPASLVDGTPDGEACSPTLIQDVQRCEGYAPLAQLVEVAGLNPVQCEFESHGGHRAGSSDGAADDLSRRTRELTAPLGASW